MRIIVDLITNNFLAVVIIQTGALLILTTYLLRNKKSSLLVQTYDPPSKENLILSVEKEIEQFLTEDNPANVFHPRLHRALYSHDRKAS